MLVVGIVVTATTLSLGLTAVAAWGCLYTLITGKLLVCNGRLNARIAAHWFRFVLWCNLKKDNIELSSAVSLPRLADTTRVSLGSLPAAADRKFIKTAAITHVVAATQYGAGAKFYPNNLQYLTIQILDKPYEDISVHLDKVADFIHSSLCSSPGSHILVHCNQGRSRSAVCLSAYLIKYHGMTADTAIEYLRNYRPVRPNSGFITQLHSYATRQRKLAL